MNALTATNNLPTSADVLNYYRTRCGLELTLGLYRDPQMPAPGLLPQPRLDLLARRWGGPQRSLWTGRCTDSVLADADPAPHLHKASIGGTLPLLDRAAFDADYSPLLQSHSGPCLSDLGESMTAQLSRQLTELFLVGLDPALSGRDPRFHVVFCMTNGGDASKHIKGDVPLRIGNSVFLPPHDHPDAPVMGAAEDHERHMKNSEPGGEISRACLGCVNIKKFRRVAAERYLAVLRSASPELRTHFNIV